MDLEAACVILGDRIKRRRISSGLESQTALARKTGLTRASINAIESGKQPPALRTLFVISKALDCDPGDLLPTIGELSASGLAIEEILDMTLKGEQDGQAKKGPAGGSC